MLCSVDLRQRVVDTYRLEGKTQAEMAERFQVSVSSLKRWLKRETLKPDKPGPKQSRTIDSKHLEELVKNNPDAYLDEYAKMLDSNKSTVSYNLLKLGISRKKNHTLQRTKPREAQNISAGH